MTDYIERGIIIWIIDNSSTETIEIRKSWNNILKVWKVKAVNWISYTQQKHPSRMRWSEVSVTQLCPILCNPMDYSPPGSSVHGILQARILEWVAILFSRGSSWLRDPTQVYHIAGRFFTIGATREAGWGEVKTLNTHTHTHTHTHTAHTAKSTSPYLHLKMLKEILQA